MGKRLRLKSPGKVTAVVLLPGMLIGLLAAGAGAMPELIIEAISEGDISNVIAYPLAAVFCFVWIAILVVGTHRVLAEAGYHKVIMDYSAEIGCLPPEQEASGVDP